MYLSCMRYNIMTKKDETMEETKEVLTFTRYCPIIDRVVTVEWGLHEWEVETYRLIEEQEKKELNETN